MFQIKDERLQILIIASVLITMGLIFVFSGGLHTGAQAGEKRALLRSTSSF
ncbi:MAG: hypothetical protein LRY51_09840 [Geovibrio sp.]|nr:hypothetical protein [Geovibrio sp.]